MNPKYRIALAPDFKVGGLCFLEFDQRPWLAEWAAEEGHRSQDAAAQIRRQAGATLLVYSHREKS